MKLRCYNAVRAEKFGKKLTPVDQLILRRSYPHTHTEIQFGPDYDNISFSATIRDGANGCRFKKIDYTLHPERWDTLEIPVTPNEETKGFKAAVDLEGKQYDLIGLLSFATELDIVKPDSKKFWCSEACAEVLQAAKAWDDFRPDSFTPTGLFFEVLYRLSLQEVKC